MNAFNYIWPMALVIIANVFYHICTKSQPEGMNPFASLTVTYAAGAVTALVCYFIFSRGGNIVKQYAKLNWSPFVLGIAIVGLEAGWIYAYKSGWNISIAQIVQSVILAIILIAVGIMVYHETLTWNKIVGIVICLAGLFFINLK